MDLRVAEEGKVAEDDGGEQVEGGDTLDVVLSHVSHTI